MVINIAFKFYSLKHSSSCLPLSFNTFYFLTKPKSFKKALAIKQEQENVL